MRGRRDSGFDSPLLSPGLSNTPSLSSNLVPEPPNFIQYQILHSLNLVHALESEIELERARRFVGWIVPDGQVRMLERIFA